MGSLQRQRRTSKPPGPAICSSHPKSDKTFEMMIENMFFNIPAALQK
jgi:hypothetical protein